MCCSLLYPAPDHPRGMARGMARGPRVRFDKLTRLVACPNNNSSSDYTTTIIIEDIGRTKRIEHCYHLLLSELQLKTQLLLSELQLKTQLYIERIK